MAGHDELQAARFYHAAPEWDRARRQPRRQAEPALSPSWLRQKGGAANPSGHHNQGAGGSGSRGNVTLYLRWDIVRLNARGSQNLHSRNLNNDAGKTQYGRGGPSPPMAGSPRHGRAAGRVTGEHQEFRVRKSSIQPIPSSPPYSNHGIPRLTDNGADHDQRDQKPWAQLSTFLLCRGRACPDRQSWP